MLGLWSGFLVFSCLALLIILSPVYRGRVVGVRQYWPLLLVALVLPLLNVSLYWRLGDHASQRALVESQRQEVLVQAFLQQYSSAEEIVSQMALAVQQDQDNPQAWFLLGRLYASQGQWSAAAEAFSHARHLSPTDVEVLFQRVQALYFVQDRQLSTELQALLEEIFSLSPDYPDALSLAAADAYQHENYLLAIDYWQRLLALFPPQSEARASIAEAIASAEDRL